MMVDFLLQVVQIIKYGKSIKQMLYLRNLEHLLMVVTMKELLVTIKKVISQVTSIMI